MSKILILDSGTQALAIARDLYEGHHEIFMITNHRHNYGDDSHVIKRVILTKVNPEDTDYINVVIGVVERYSIDTIIPMSDRTALFMSQFREKLSEIVSIEVPNYSSFIKGYNKSSLMELCAEKRYPHPETFTQINSIEDCNNLPLKYPLLIKPDITCGARGMKLINSREELLENLPKILSQYGQCHLQQYILPGGKQVEVQLYINGEKKLVASSVISKFRWYPEKGGSSCCAETIQNDKIVNILYNLLCDLNWCGFADFDTIEDPMSGELLIMELNPRVPACVKASIVSGVSWGQIIAAEYLNHPSVKYEYRPGEILKHLGFETLWFIQSKNRLKSSPFILRLFGKNIHYQDFDGLNFKPFVMGTIKNIKQLLKPEFRKSKNS